MILDKDLRERHGGGWEGLNDTEIRERYPERTRPGTRRTASRPPRSPTGSPPRCSAPPRRVAEQVTGSDGLAVVVSHGAALRLGMSRLLGLPDELSGVLGPLSNCSWSVLGLRHGRWRLLEHNAGTLPEPVLSDDR